MLVARRLLLQLVACCLSLVAYRLSLIARKTKRLVRCVRSICWRVLRRAQEKGTQAVHRILLRGRTMGLQPGLLRDTSSPAVPISRCGPQLLAGPRGRRSVVPCEKFAGRGGGHLQVGARLQ